MAAKPYVKTAKGHVDKLRSRLTTFGFETPLDRAVDLDTIASAYLNCEIIRTSGLSDQSALQHLELKYGVDISAEPSVNKRLAGALYVSSDGFFRWLFIDSADVPERQRFTLAHELGHLVLEAEPNIERYEATVGDLVPSTNRPTVASFGRCSDKSLEFEQDDAHRRKHSPLGDAALREIHANHFAAELLMPYDGVRTLLANMFGATGVRTESDLQRAIRDLVSVYQVSRATAQLRLTKDLAIVPRSRQSTMDLFD